MLYDGHINCGADILSEDTSDKPLYDTTRCSGRVNFTTLSNNDVFHPVQLIHL